MKNTKRLIITLLALVLLSLNITGFAYYTGDVVESDNPVEFETAVKTLYGLGVLPELKFDGYDENVTREDFAGYVRNFGGQSITVPLPAENDITMGEAIKLLIQMSDNVTLAEYYGTYPDGYFSVASSMGITHGLAGVQAYDKITYGMAVQMLYNSMRVTPPAFGSVTSGGKVKYHYDSNRTVLTEYLDVTLKQGFVTTDGFWSLNPETLPDNDGIVIDGTAYKLKYPGMDDYVGFIVNYYYNSKEDIILAVEKTTRSKQVILRGSYITNFTSNTYYYEVDGKRRKYQLEDNFYVVSNYSANMNVNIDMYPANADVVLVDSDGNNKYETVLIKTYTEIQVQALDVDREQLLAKDGGVYKLSKDVPFRVYSKGALVDAKTVKTDDFVTIVVDEKEDALGNKGNTVREIYLSSDKTKGTVSSYSSDARYATVTIDGEEYVVSNSMGNKRNMGLGVSGTFIINFKGEISNLVVDVPSSSSGSATTTSLGYLIKIRKMEDSEDTPYRAKILTQKGTIENFYLVEKVKLNKSRVKEDIRGLLGAEPDGIGGYSEVTKQVIQYEVNAENKITSITTALAYDTVNDRAHSDVQYGDYKLHESLTGTYRTYNGSFGHELLIGPNTIVFTDTNSVGEEENANFSVGKPIKADADLGFTAYNYELNAPFADAVVFNRGGVAAPDTVNEPMFMVIKTKIEYSDYYGEGVNVVEYLNIESGAVAKAVMTEDVHWMGIESGKNGEVKSYDVGFSKDLKAGDLFHMSLNELGEIDTIIKHYEAYRENNESDVSGALISGTYDNNQPISYVYAEDFKTQGNTWRQGGKFYKGYPLAATADYIVISESSTDRITTAKRTDLKYFKMHASHTRVYKVKVYKNSLEYEKSTLAAVAPSVKGSSECVIYTSNVQLMAVIVYEQEI